jgi:hypothetical protein
MEVKVVGLMTSPRYTASWATGLIHRAFHEAGITLLVSGGVFYQQAMQQMFENAVKDGLDAIITVDMDSIFSAKHVNRLLARCFSDDSIDALASLQARRGMVNPLLSVATDAKPGDKVQIDINGNPIKVRTAHFGLTVIKASKLQDVCKPWFLHSPDENGEYSDKRVDADIWFWRQWEKAGKSVYVDPTVSIGHQEEVVTYYDENMEHCTTYPQEYKAAFL